MRSIQEHKEKIESRGVRIVAISVDPPDVTRAHAEKHGYPFLFLSDEKKEVLQRYDLVHPAGFRGNDIPRPAEFLIDPTGVIRWVNLTENYRVRPKGEDLLKALDEVGVGKPLSR